MSRRAFDRLSKVFHSGFGRCGARTRSKGGGASFGGRAGYNSAGLAPCSNNANAIFPCVGALQLFFALLEQVDQECQGVLGTHSWTMKAKDDRQGQTSQKRRPKLYCNHPPLRHFLSPSSALFLAILLLANMQRRAKAASALTLADVVIPAVRFVARAMMMTRGGGGGGGGRVSFFRQDKTCPATITQELAGRGESEVLNGTPEKSGDNCGVGMARRGMRWDSFRIAGESGKQVVWFGRLRSAGLKIVTNVKCSCSS